MESEKGLKTPEKLCWVMGSLQHFLYTFELRILFADAIVYFQVFLYVRQLPPYEFLLEIFM